MNYMLMPNGEVGQRYFRSFPAQRWAFRRNSWSVKSEQRSQSNRRHLASQNLV